MIRELLKRVHFTLGLTLAVPLAVLGLTGSYLALTEPVPPIARVAAHLPHARPANVDAIVAAAQAAAPHRARPSQYVASGPDSLARVTFTSPRRRSARGSLQYYVDPFSLAVTAAPARGGTLYAYVHALHENWLSGSTGRLVNGCFGVAMILLGATGPFAWWPGKRQLREGFTVRRGAGGFRFFRDVHRATGIWACLFLVVVSITGTYIIFPQAIGGAVATVFPGRALWTTAVPALRSERGAATMSTADAVALARKTVGGGRVLGIAFAGDEQPLRIELLPLRRARSDSVTVLIDPYAQRVLDVRDPRTYSFGERIIAMMRPIHEGHTGGPAWRIVLVALGLTPAFFAITGVTMWLFKRRRRLPVQAAV